MSDSPLPADCPNCGTHLAGDYCHACGQKRAAVNPTLRELVTELAESITSVDGKLLQSVGLLLVSPGRLTQEVLAGRRARYVTPLRLYLTFSVLYFAIAAVAPRLEMVKVTLTDSEPKGLSVGASVGGPDRQEPVPADQAAAERQMERRANQLIISWIPRLMFILVPLFAALMGLTVRRADRNYPQHLYAALHLHAVWFLVGAVIVATGFVGSPVVSQVVATLGFIYGATYFVLLLKRAYRVSTSGALWRATMLGIVYFVVVLTTMLSIALPIILGTGSRE